MRKWVKYDLSKDRVAELDKRRLLSRAKKLIGMYEKNKGGYGVDEVFFIYKPLIEAALDLKIDLPLDKPPVTHAMKEGLLPGEFENALTEFRSAIESRPAVYNVLDIDTIFHQREKYIKEENGITYILEYFED